MRALQLILGFIFILSPFGLSGDDIIDIKLYNLYFKFNSTHYSNKSYKINNFNSNTLLNKWKQLLDCNPEILVELKGFQEKTEDKHLAFLRADKVRADLIDKGVNPANLKNITPKDSTIGDLECLNSKDKHLIRRVEFLITEKK